MILILIYRIDVKYILLIYNDQGKYYCNIKNKSNNIFKNSNIIIVLEKDIIEVFQFLQNNDNTNNNNNLVKKLEINNNNNNINNNNLFNINDNSNNDNDILCIEYGKGFIMCGHSSGLMSIWKPDPEVYLKKLQGEKLHNGAINKILFTQLSDNKNYFISCGSDKIIKLYCMEDNNISKTINFEDEVMDIKQVKDFNQQTIFIVSLKNGILKVLNETFEHLYDIPSRFKTKSTRYVLSLNNPKSNSKSENNVNNEEGDLLLITEGKFIDIFTWIKEIQMKHKNKLDFQHPQSNNKFYFGGQPFFSS